MNLIITYYLMFFRQLLHISPVYSHIPIKISNPPIKMFIFHEKKHNQATKNEFGLAMAFLKLDGLTCMPWNEKINCA